MAAVLLAVLAYAVLVWAITAIEQSPADRVTEEVRSRLDVPEARAEMMPPAPADGCRETVVTDEYGFDVPILECPTPGVPSQDRTPPD
jgi:hypothetical protein